MRLVITSVLCIPESESMCKINGGSISRAHLGEVSELADSNNKLLELGLQTTTKLQCISPQGVIGISIIRLLNRPPRIRLVHVLTSLNKIPFAGSPLVSLQKTYY